MFHKFNDTSIYTKFIKQLVATTYVPTIEVWKPGKPTIAGFQYITKNYIVEALQSCQEGDRDFPLENINNNYFKILRPYIEGEFYQNVTSNYVSNNFRYDGETHFYLGQYLRMLRDLHDLDLMCYYNCVNQIAPETFSIKDDFSIVTDNEEQSNYKILMAPIYFNTDYTIFADSEFPVTVTAIFYDGVSRITSYTSDTGTKRFNTTKRTKPILYKVDQQIAEGYSSMYYRNYLTLLIQVPKTCNNVVVLEGDYTSNKIYVKNNENKIPNMIFGKDAYTSGLTKEEVDNHCKVIPALTRSIKNELYAYDDTLLEYLLLHAISSDDEITKNIERVQTYVSSYEFEKYTGANFGNNFSFKKGIWSDELRMFLYDVVTTNHTGKKLVYDPVKVDISGYVDKNVETVITRGQDV